MYSFGCGILSRTWSLRGRMAQDLSEKELLKMEVEQLKKEVKTPRALVSLLLPSPHPLLHPFLVPLEPGCEGGSDGQQGSGRRSSCLWKELG